MISGQPPRRFVDDENLPVVYKTPLPWCVFYAHPAAQEASIKASICWKRGWDDRASDMIEA